MGKPQNGPGGQGEKRKVEAASIAPPETRRWLLVAVLALATLAMHAVLTSATPSQAPFAATGSGHDFKLPVRSTPSVSETTPADPAADVTVTARVDRRSVLAGSDGRLYAEVTITGGPGDFERRLPTDLIVVLDHSGSMNGEKIRQAKQATQDLISRLSPQDTFALVAFSHGARTLIDRDHATDANRQRWRFAVDQVQSGGGTDMVGGLDEALRILRSRQTMDRPCRVLLVSDGRPNTQDGLPERARSAGHLGAALSSLGVGADFNETLMGQLADIGTGNYYFLDRAETIANVFAGELEAGRGTLARDLQIALKPAPGVSLLDAAGYPIETTADGAVIRPGHLYAGQTRRLWLALDVDAERPFPSRPLGELSVSWREEEGPKSRQLGSQLQVACVKDRDQYLAGIDSEAWGRAVVSEEYGRLQNEVADFVRNGQRHEAERQIARYTELKTQENSIVQNADVTQNLEQIETLLEEVDDAFTGADQVMKRKMLSKKKHQVSQELRRLDDGGGQ